MEKKISFFTRPGLGVVTLSDMLPMLEIIAMQQRCKLNRNDQFRYVWFILQRSVIEN